MPLTAALLTSLSTSLTCWREGERERVVEQVRGMVLTATWSSLLMVALSPVPQYASAIVNIPALLNNGS